MQPAPEYPAPYQINTRIWRTERSRILGRPATLGDIPGPTWTAWAAWGSTGSGGMAGALAHHEWGGVAPPGQPHTFAKLGFGSPFLDNAPALALHGRSNGQGRCR